MRPKLFQKVMVGARDSSRSKRFMVGNFFAKSLSVDDFAFTSVALEASKRAGVPDVTSADGCPDGAGWERLCKAVQVEFTSFSKIGAGLLRERVVHAMSQRMAIEEQFRINASQLEAFQVKEPIFIVGLPRACGRYSAHLLGRSGMVMTMRSEDTYFPAIVTARERRIMYEKEVKRVEPYFPDLKVIQTLKAGDIDDDLQLHLLTPYSHAWGLLHGLDAYLYENLDVDQTPVYEVMKKTLRLFQWYASFDEFSDALPDKSFEVIDEVKVRMDIRWGDVSQGPNHPWVIHSPFALLSLDNMQSAFPDMRLIWIHRALSQCIPSFCSTLTIHHSLYYSRLPTETILAGIGEKVVGLFSHAAEASIELLATFPRERMVHWSNRDVRRHGPRIIERSCRKFGLKWNRPVQIRCASAQTENDNRFRPLHDAPLNYFALHDGKVNEAFAAYIHQFEDFAFEPRFGVNIQESSPLIFGSDETMVTYGRAEQGKLQGSIPAHASSSGHFHQEAKGIARF